MPRGTDKSRVENDVFMAFVNISKLDLDIDTIIQGEPPCPDISCIESGVKRGFELSRITDEGIERKISSKRFGVFAYSINPVASLKKKLDKQYQAGIPTDLILHEGMTPIDELSQMNGEFLGALNKYFDRLCFCRVWLLDITGGRIVASYNRASAIYEPRGL